MRSSSDVDRQDTQYLINLKRIRLQTCLGNPAILPAFSRLENLHPTRCNKPLSRNHKTPQIPQIHSL